MRINAMVPHPALRPHVLRYLSVAADHNSPSTQMAGPAGGPALIVLLEGTQHVAAPGGALELAPSAYFCGHVDRAQLTRLSSAFHVFAVHFTATGAYSLLRQGVRELTNRAVELGTVAGADVRAWSESLREVRDDDTRAALTDRLLLARISRAPMRQRTSQIIATASQACALMERSDGGLSVQSLADQLCVSSRTLLRHFEEVVGLPVRTHRSIVRFLSMRAFLDHNPFAPWSEVALRFGYADQSHLIRAFRRYYGEAPSVFRARLHEARLIKLTARRHFADA